MPKASLFRWQDGRGWLILSGGGAPGNDPETLALSKVPAGDPLVYVFAASNIEAGDKHLTALEDAGAPTGYLLDVTAEDDETLRAQMEEAGLVILGDGPNASALRGGLVGVGIETMKKAFEEGASVLAIGAGASVLGKFYLNDKGELRPGFEWLSGAIIIPQSARDTFKLDSARYQAILTEYPDCFIVVLGPDSALAYGPEGEVESWGERQIAVTLGKAYLQPSQEQPAAPTEPEEPDPQ